MLEICHANGDLRRVADTFIDMVYDSTYGTAPPPAQHVFVALDPTQDAVVGTIGLDTFIGGWKPRFDSIYNVVNTPHPINEDNVLEFGRLTATAHDNTMCARLIGAAAGFGLSLGLQYGWCEMKPAVRRCLSRTGIEFCDAATELRPEGILPGDMPYYTSKRRPHTTVAVLEQMVSATASYTERMTAVASAA